MSPLCLFGLLFCFGIWLLSASLKYKLKWAGLILNLLGTYIFYLAIHLSDSGFFQIPAPWWFESVFWLCAASIGVAIFWFTEA
jgi:hypothetical protein